MKTVAMSGQPASTVRGQARLWATLIALVIALVAALLATPLTAHAGPSWVYPSNWSFEGAGADGWALWGPGMFYERASASGVGMGTYSGSYVGGVHNTAAFVDNDSYMKGYWQYWAGALPNQVYKLHVWVKTNHPERTHVWFGFAPAFGDPPALSEADKKTYPGEPTQAGVTQEITIVKRSPADTARFQVWLVQFGTGDPNAYAYFENVEVEKDPQPSLGITSDGWSLSAGPYYLGDTLTASFTVKNNGVSANGKTYDEAGDWKGVTLNAWGGPASTLEPFPTTDVFSLAPGETRSFTVHRTLDLLGPWIGRLRANLPLKNDHGGWLGQALGADPIFSIQVTDKPADTLTIASASASPNPAGEGDTITFSAMATDSQGHAVSYQWSEGSTVLASAASFTTSSLAVGTHTITVKATCAGGQTVTKDVAVTVATKPAHKVSKPAVASSVFKGRTLSITGSLYPAHAVGTTPVRVQAWYRSGSRWLLKRTLSARIVRAGASSSTWKVSYVPKSRGIWVFRASAPRDAKHKGSASVDSRYVRVK